MLNQSRSVIFWSLVTWSAKLFAQVPVICNSPADQISFSVESRGVYPGYFPAQVPPVYVRVRLEAFASAPFVDGWWHDRARFILQVRKLTGTIYSDPVNLSSRLEYDTTGLVVFLDPDSSPPAFKKGDKLSLYAIIPKTGGNPPICVQGRSGGEAEIEVPATSNFAATVEPSWVPKQELTNGAKRDVGHLDVKLDFPTLLTGRYARLYAKGNQTLSTDGKDQSTKLEGVLGAAGRFAGGWLVPWQAEAQMTGDQRLSNASAVISGGTDFIIPWAWARPTFWNGAVRAPFSPEFSFAAQHETRLKQDAESKKKFQDTQAFRLYGEVKWSPIHVLTGSGYTKEDVSVEFSGKAWYLPNQLNSTGRRIDRLEGLVEASVLFPLRKFEVVGGLSPSGATAAKQRIRLKYTHGANDAAGFKHYSQLTIGLEVIK